MGQYVKVARTGEIQPGEGKLVEVAGKQVAVFNVGGTMYAIDDACTHQGGPLSEGPLSGSQVTCPWHGAAFDVTTGRVQSPPAPKDVRSYPVRIAGDDIEIDLTLAGGAS
jgi:nitrite reductase/ring-hydroxylating ferredoxin subunit